MQVSELGALLGMRRLLSFRAAASTAPTASSVQPTPADVEALDSGRGPFEPVGLPFFQEDPPLP